MKSLVQRLGPLVPPLRLIVTTQCNARCPFCHAEGAPRDRDRIMSNEVLYAAVYAAREMNLPRITLTGGEPTLLDELPKMASQVRQVYPSCSLGLSTNGVRLPEHWSALCAIVNTVDISIHSLDPRVWKRYTGVAPLEILDFLDTHQTDKGPRVEINCLVMEQNCGDIEDVIETCQQRGFSITLMLPVPSHRISPEVSKTIRRIVVNSNLTRIRLGSTPVLEGRLDSNSTIRLKLPFLSGLIGWRKCTACSRSAACGEFFCALRVYPDGTIGACRVQPSKRSARSPEQMQAELGRELSHMVGEFVNWAQLLKLGLTPRN